MSGREATALVAGREIRERVRERSFQVSTVLNVVIVVAVVALSSVFGGETTFTVGVADPAAEPVARAAAAAAGDFELETRTVDAAEARAGLEDGSLDAVLGGRGIEVEDEPEEELVTVLQSANREVQAQRALEQAGLSGAEARRALSPPPLPVRSLQGDGGGGESGFAFFVVIMLWGQLVGFGYWVAAGVVEEKTSRVVEVVLSTIRPAHLLAGKTIGLGLLALGTLLLVAVVGLAAAGVSGALEIDGDVLTAAALALAWFVVGYAFYACAFACAGALVPRQEELQSSMTPLNIALFASFFLAFAVQSNPTGTLAHITAFLPITAPITMPPRIVGGDAPALEIVASFAITLAAAAALVPVAARIYSGGVLRTGSALKLREAWRAARA